MGTRGRRGWQQANAVTVILKLPADTATDDHRSVIRDLTDAQQRRGSSAERPFGQADPPPGQAGDRGSPTVARNLAAQVLRDAEDTQVTG